MKDNSELQRINGAFVIFAANPNMSVDEVMQHFAFNGIDFKVLLGSYAGMTETSYCVPHKHIAGLIEAGLLYDQESLLVLGAMEPSIGMRSATIVYLHDNQESEQTGYFAPVSKEEAIVRAGWTFDPSSEQFFTIKTDDELTAEESA